MNLQAVVGAALVIFMFVFIAVMWKIYNGMKQFLSSNIEEAIIVSGECMTEQLEDVSRSMTGRIRLLQNENITLREDISRQLSGIISIIRDSNDKAEIGVNSIVKELNYIIPALRDEMTKMLQTLSENAGTFQKSTLKNFEDEIKKFIKAIDDSYRNIERAADEQNKAVTNIAGTVQCVLQTSARDIQSDFAYTQAEIQNIITSAVQQIDEDYQSNMRRMFQAMADNLAAITQELRASSASGELSINTQALETKIQAMTQQLEEINSKTVKPAKTDGTKKVLEEVSAKLDTIIERLNHPAPPETPSPVNPDEAPATPKTKRASRKKNAADTEPDKQDTPANT